MTINLEFLNKLLPGDLVLVDRGFSIIKDVARMQISLQIPTFTKGCTQLSPKDVEETKRLANIRIHRVIGATRQRFSIMMSVLPIDFVKPKALRESKK